MTAPHWPGPPARWGVIADDLTGATDVAAAFAARGFAALALVNLRAPLPLRADVVVLTTNSRHDPPRGARRKVQRACRWLRSRRVPVLYKKIDSTVKGNIVAEVEAIRAAAGFGCAVVCPANPSQGRVVRHGVLRVRDQVWGKLAAIYAAQGRDHSVVVHAPVSAKKIVEAIRAGAQFLIADAVNQRDLTTLARAGLDSSVPMLLAGSAGLAAALAETLAARESRKSAAEARAADGWQRSGQSGPARRRLGLVLVFVGSQNPVTQRQLGALVLAASPRLLDVADLARISIAGHFLGPPGCLVVRVPVHQHSDATLVRNLRRLMPVFRRRRVAAMVLTGGDTALLICRWLRVAGISIQGEIAPGLAWGRLVGGAAHSVPVCTKPGGFGDERSLVAAVDFFSGRSRKSFNASHPRASSSSFS